MDKVVSGWRVAGLTSFGSGEPYSVSFTSTVQGWPSSRADIIANPSPANQSIGAWFNPAAFAVPAPFTYGNSARNFLFGPGSFNWDAAIFKEFGIKERLHLDFRAEFFNALNHPNFALPATAFDSPVFGTISATSTSERQIQFGLRLDY